MLRTRVLLQLRFAKLQKKVRDAKNKTLYRVAGLVRTAAKRSMRTRAGASNPGFPPHAHTRGGLRVIEFVVDTGASAAIVGPLKFPGSNFFNEPVPYIHEFGALAIHRRRFYSYPARPYMSHTLKALMKSGKIPREIKVSMGQVL